MKIRLSIVSLAAAAMLGMFPMLASANTAQEIATAAEHAGYAAKANDIQHVKLHLHHVMNCLVGPHGTGFYAPAGDPCKGMGNGIENDDGHYSQAARKDLQNVERTVAAGLNTQSYKTAVEAAKMAKSTLVDAKDEK